MSWRILAYPGISASSPPYRPLVRTVTDASFKYTLYRKRKRSYDLAYGGWQAWDAWTDFEFFFPGCWFINGGTAYNDTSGPGEYRLEFQIEVAAHGSPWAILWVNTITPIGGGATSTEENYLLILPGATYTANFTAPADTELTLDVFEIHYPAP